MSFTDKQIAALQAPLNRANVRQRSQAGRQLSYVEGWFAIAEANRIFGFGMWDRHTVEMRLLSDPVMVGDKWRVYYAAKAHISVSTERGMVARDGWGYGSGIDKDMGQAHESAIKEAETDAMKRALMTFGNPFGLALYDKDQANVVDERNSAPAVSGVGKAEGEPSASFKSVPSAANSDEDESKALYLEKCRTTMKRGGRTEAQARDWFRVEAQNRKEFGLTQADVDSLLGDLKAEIDRVRAAA